MNMPGFPSPSPGASLLLSFSFRSKTLSNDEHCNREPSSAFLILGTGPLAAQRAFSALEAEARVIVLARCRSGTKDNMERTTEDNESSGASLAACEEIKWRVAEKQIEFVDLDSITASEGSDSTFTDLDRDAWALECFLRSSAIHATFLCITDTLPPSPPSPSGSSASTPFRRTHASASAIYAVCRSRNISVNTTDYPDLCDFSFTATYRFPSDASGVVDRGTSGPLQIGITTNGQGCRLAGRLKREIVARLPRDVGRATENVGRMRGLAKERAKIEVGKTSRRAKTKGKGNEDEWSWEGEDGCENDDPDADSATPNRPVPQRNASSKLRLKSPSSMEDSILSTEDDETPTERARRRMKWVAQMSEYWPIEQLAALTQEKMLEILEVENDSARAESFSTSSNPDKNPASFTSSAPPTSQLMIPSLHSLSLSPPSSPPKPGLILLVGSGPGHPSLLTLAAHHALTSLGASSHHSTPSKPPALVLADKLVPAPVLALIPPSIPVRIAAKFPGNADASQNEMMEAAVAAALTGTTVVRLKQGDPSIYGRFGEEVLYFRHHGLKTLVVPGVSSAIAGPTFAGIPVTQRGAAESVMVCTGVGRGGRDVGVPGYVRGRTLVLLMGVARLSRVISALTDLNVDVGRRDGAVYPTHTPIAIIERASMPDQRIIESTLGDIVSAMESADVGAQRPPGMIVVGWSVLALWGEGDVTVLDQPKEGTEAEEEARDRGRVVRWLGEGQRWRVRDGLDEAWDIFTQGLGLGETMSSESK